MLNQIKRKLRRMFANKNADDILFEVFQNLNSMIYFVGCDIFSENYTWWNFRLGIVAFDIVTYLMINVYSLVFYWGDLLSVAFCLVTFSMGFQGAAKILTYVGYCQFFINFRSEYLDNYKPSPHLKISNEQQKFSQQCFILTKIIKYLYLSCAALTLIYPLLATVLTGERTLPFGFILPWIEPYGNPGFFLNFVHHSLQVFFVIIGIIVSDSLYVSCIILICGNMTIMKLMFDDLIEHCRQHEKDTEKFEEISKNLTKIIKMHQVLQKNIQNLGRNYDAHCFVHIGSLVFQLTVTMVACLSLTWYPGYAILVGAYFQLFVACFFGSMLSSRCQQFEMEIYDTEWYRLSVMDQKNVLLFLKMGQRPFKLTYGIGDLNLNTFVEISKKVYQLFMVIQSFSN